jgi:ArsR family transcriptional regulator
MATVEAPLVACLDDPPAAPRRLTPTETATIAKALGSTTRLRILELFHTRCPRTVGDIAAEIPLAQSTVSNHLHILSDAGAIHTFRSGPRVWHCLNRSMIDGLADAITALAKRTHNV